MYGSVGRLLRFVSAEILTCLGGGERATHFQDVGDVVLKGSITFVSKGVSFPLPTFPFPSAII